MANRRILYACWSAAIAPLGTTNFTSAHVVHGLQSAGTTLSFSLEQVFEIGQLEIYENIENVPNVEVTMEKVLDGYPLIYHLATVGATDASLAGRQNGQCIIAMNFFNDTYQGASGTPITEVMHSGASVSALTYTFPVEGNCTESVTFVGNNRTWRNAGFQFTGKFLAGGPTDVDQPKALTLSGSGGVQRREDVLFLPKTGEAPNFPSGISLDANGQYNTTLATILPEDIDGVSAGGLNLTGSDGYPSAKVQTITVSTNLGRQELFQLGARTPYFRFIDFPVEVTTTIDVISTGGDQIGGTEAGLLGDGNNISNNTIRIRTRDDTRINLGTKNKLASITQQGGDTGGGNITQTYTYTNFNSLTVTHPSDPSGFGAF